VHPHGSANDVPQSSYPIRTHLFVTRSQPVFARLSQDSMADNVKVAVRMRPFNQREKDLNSTCCVRMVKSTQQTILVEPDSGSASVSVVGRELRRWALGLVCNAQAKSVLSRLISATTRSCRETTRSTRRKTSFGRTLGLACWTMRTKVMSGVVLLRFGC
jgi:hypothetical protein